MNPLGFVAGKGVRFLAVGLLLAGLIVALEVLIPGRKLTQRCLKCGNAFCGRCQIGTGRKGLCTQCYHLFYMKRGVSAQARNEKQEEVKRRAAKRSLVFRGLSIVAPGAGQVAEGMPVIGSLFLLVWIWGVSQWLAASLPYPLPDSILGVGSQFPLLTVAAMLVVLVLANLTSRPTLQG